MTNTTDKSAVFCLNCTFYDVISGARGYHENFLPTLRHNSSPDKHIRSRVNSQSAWLVRNAISRFRFKMTKILNFARTVAQPTKVDSQISTDFWKAQTMLFHVHCN